MSMTHTQPKYSTDLNGEGLRVQLNATFVDVAKDERFKDRPGADS